MASALGCAHPGELVRRVMTTHPASVNPGSKAGERRASATEDVPDVTMGMYRGAHTY
jgi:hypothetical protein